MLAGPYLAAAALLVVAGVGKVRDPLPLVRALRSARLPGTATAVRCAALVETAVGCAAPFSRAAAVAVALSYAGFTAFVLLALRRGGVLASCGCFGTADTPPTRTHAAVTGVAAVVALAAPVTPSVDLALLVTTGAVAVTAYLVLARLPLLSAPAAGVAR